MSISIGPGLAGKTIENKNKHKKSMNMMKTDDRMVFGNTETRMGQFGIDEQPLPIQVDKCRRPKLILPFDFDGTMFSTGRNWLEALVGCGVVYSHDSVDDAKLPSAVAVENGTFKVSRSNMSDYFGIPTNLPDDDVWDSLTRLLTAKEKRNPSRLFPGVRRAVCNFSNLVQFVVVTCNQSHQIESMLLRELPSVDIGVIRVAGYDKSAVLKKLLDHNRCAFRYRSSAIHPTPFFGDSVSDMESCSDLDDIMPIGVYRDDRQRIRGDSWKPRHTKRHIQLLRDFGARQCVSHKGIEEIVNSFCAHLAFP